MRIAVTADPIHTAARTASTVIPGRPRPYAASVRILAAILSVLLIAVGVLWTGQGLGWFEGSSMTGQNAWAIIGPIVAGFGVALGISLFQNRQR